MLFGDKNVFGIEIYINPDQDGYDIWGRSCIHICGSQVGDIEDPHCGLNDFFVTLNSRAQSARGLVHASFQGLTDREVFEALRNHLYDGPERDLAVLRANATEFGKFDFLTNVGENFNDWCSFLFTRDHENLTILTQRFDETPLSFSVPMDAFEQTVRSFVNWMSSIALNPNKAQEPTL